MLRRRGREKRGHSRLRATARADSIAGQHSWCQTNTRVSFCTPFTTWGVKLKSLETSHLNQSLRLRNKDVRREAHRGGVSRETPHYPKVKTSPPQSDPAPRGSSENAPFTGLTLGSCSPSGETFQENLGSGSLCHLSSK